jgi:SAM-dependent methyltransferase
MDPQSIDWNKMWLAARDKKSWKAKTAKDWDKKAVSFAKRNMRSDYVTSFINELKTDSKLSILDIGAGPGTLSLPLSGKAKIVTAVDYSPRMLEILTQKAAEGQIKNIYPVNASWEDDWQEKGIKKHDLVIASRSLSVNNLEQALVKLDQFAKKSVYISDRVGPGPFDPELFKAVGKNFYSGPDYIYTLNILYKLGIHAQVKMIQIDNIRDYQNREQAYEDRIWMLDNPDSEELKRFKKYVNQQLHPLPGNKIRGIFPPVKWALIYYHK